MWTFLTVALLVCTALAERVEPPLVEPAVAAAIKAEWSLTTPWEGRPVQEGTTTTALAGEEPPSIWEFFCGTGPQSRANRPACSVEADNNHAVPCSVSDTSVAAMLESCHTSTEAPPSTCPRLLPQDHQHSRSGEVNNSIAFTIVAHQGAYSLLQLLDAIYLPKHFYCIHVDLASQSSFVDVVEAMAKHRPNVLLADPSVSNSTAFLL